VIPPNAQQNRIKNTKYTVLTFLPLVLFNQFRYFFNLFFLFIALTQFFKPLQIGYIFAYVSPLVLILTLTMLKEIFDDWKRYIRDKESNVTSYIRMTAQGP
jgi:phospholipid-translocating ATPase